MIEFVVLIFNFVQYMMQSSAYSIVLTEGLMFLLMLLIAIRNNVMLIEDPWGSVPKSDNKVSSNFTTKVLLVRTLFMNLRMFLLNFHFWSIV